jgi:hypothetical protein
LVDVIPSAIIKIIVFGNYFSKIKAPVFSRRPKPDGIVFELRDNADNFR